MEPRWGIERAENLNRSNRRWQIMSAALAVLIGIVPVLVGGVLPANAAPPIPRRCDQAFNVTKAPPASDALPGTVAGQLETILDNPFYDYENPGELLRNLPEPTQDDLDRVGTNSGRYDSGTVDHAYASRADYLKRKRSKGETPLSWEAWRNTYIPNQGNNGRGVAYEGVGARQFGLSGPDWICQGQIPGAPEGRTYDAVNVKEKIAYEFKSSSGAFRASQLRSDGINARATGFRIVYVFGQEPKTAHVKLINNEEGVSFHKVKATPRLTTPAPPAQGPQSGILSPRNQAPSQGPLPETLGRSGRNLAEAREVAAVDEEEAQRAGRPNGRVARPGGVDFTTMELRYVQDAADGSGLQYAFNIEDLPNDEDVSSGGLEVAQLTSDTFFTWLALPASSFWVNLNPTQPDLILDDNLATTDAGRILLEADLAMKKFGAGLTNPTTQLGAQFWDSLQFGPDPNLAPCFGVRVWIVPAPATVREEDGRLYILQAPLKVMSAPLGESVPSDSGVDVCANDPPSTIAHNQAVFDTLIRPRIETEVNTAAQFEDLRRVYLSRVAAEWIRQRSAGRTTAFTDIIDSGDVSRWPARVPWDRQEVFQRFLTSFNNGEYQEEHTFPGSPLIFLLSVGGVDFSDSPRDNLSPEAFRAAAPALPATIDSSQLADRQDEDGVHTWFGGEAGPPRHVPPPQNPGPGPGVGPLPVTGKSVSLVIGIGLALLAAGIGLLYWRGRRRPHTFPR